MAMSRVDYMRPISFRKRYSSPLNEETIQMYIMLGFLDEDHNITKKGKDNGFVMQKLLGAETEEHYQKYLKLYDEYIKKWFEWANDERIPFEQEPDLIEKW